MKDEYLHRLLAEEENILLETRQHWFMLLQSIFVELVLAITTIIVVSLVQAFVIPNPLTSLWYLLVILPIISLFRDVWVWYNHKYVVTTRRVIQVFGIINKNVTDSSLEKVNDVKMVQSFWGRIFNFGDIEILTASELGINRFTTIGNPVYFKIAMLNAKVNLEKEEKRPPSPVLSDTPSLLSQLSNLHKQGILTDLEYQEKKAELLKRF